MNNVESSGEQKRERRQLRAVENFYLWVVSGGRCSFQDSKSKVCNKLLILNEDGRLSNVGEKAHIIGHKGPRYEFAEQYGYKDEDLENISNLMMLCADHHKLIDDHAEAFPPDDLFRMKREHEERVVSLGEINRKSIAIIHKRLAPPIRSLDLIEGTNKLLLEAIELQEEFVDTSLEGWEEAKAMDIALHKQFLDVMACHKDIDVEIFPLSPIPLLIHLGTLITDTISATVYQYDRDQQLWVSNQPGTNRAPSIQTKCQSAFNEDATILVVAVSVSASIDTQDIHNVVENEYDLMDISIENPGINRVLFQEDVQIIQKEFKLAVEKQLQQKRYKEIHLFYSGPAGLAVEIGRGINTRMWPNVYLYHFNIRNNPRYQRTFSV
ncbi:SAVED domain-containing protein [Cohnella phaseoli]|uniref:HNH endonuclease n=1 Tax=Cohnella phaseoli TaxID=456490 RepID=A0A3D9KT42_9BACL|nr:SAVED domain-containing protein [Cohnella phaseoli]RED89168.1 HNH endonuclease [Cohnella phaseoli]